MGTTEIQRKEIIQTEKELKGCFSAETNCHVTALLSAMAVFLTELDLLQVI